MVVTSPGSTNHVEGDGGLGRRTVAARDDSWFALVVSGLVVLGAMPFYRYLGPKSTASWCTSFGSGFTCHTHVLSNGFFGIGLGSSAPGMFGNSSPSATTYWVVSIFLGVCLVVGVRRVRLGKMGTVGRIWPIVTIGATTLVLVIASRDWFSVVPSEMTIRGMQSLVLIALGLIVLAVLDHAWGLGLYCGLGFYPTHLCCHVCTTSATCSHGLGPRFALAGRRFVSAKPDLAGGLSTDPLEEQGFGFFNIGGFVPIESRVNELPD